MRPPRPARGALCAGTLLFLFAPLLGACVSAPPASAAAGPATPLAPTPQAARQPAPPSLFDEAADQRFLRDVAETRSFHFGRPLFTVPLPDGKQVLFLRAEPRRPRLHLYAFDVASGKVRELITPEQVLKGAAETLSPEEKAQRERMRISVGGFTSYQLSRAGDLVLVSLAGRVYVIELGSGRSHEVASPDAKGDQPFDPGISPDGKLVSFVRGGELWVVPAAGGRERQLTRGATPLLTHAQAEFVAQEEMGRFTGYWWSPDSRMLVYEEADATGVEMLYLGDPTQPMEKVTPAPYPRPGKANVKVRLAVMPATGGKPTFLEWDRARYPYLADVVWREHAPPTIVVESRDQHDLALLAVDPRTGKTHELLREHDDLWLNLPIAYAWLRDGSGFLWSSERAGAWQLELRTPDGKLVRPLGNPALGFRGLRHVDLEKREVVVAAGAEPVEQQLFALSLDTGAARPLTRGPGFHDASYAREAGTYVLQTETVDSWGRAEVFRADGTRAGELPSVAERPPFLPRVEIAKVGPAPGFWTALVRPRNFDPKLRYPVIVDVYGGPLSTVVHPSAGAYLTAQWIADHGFLVAYIDGRGTPERGRAWERAIWHKFAEVPLGDQVAGLQALAAREPAIDRSRVGIMGHSFGGYMAALAVLRRPDVYRVAIAGAPVVDWLDYDTHYTERYLGVPDKDTSVYDANGLLRYAAGLERPLLLIHGTADDNVHFNQSLKLGDALFRAGKRFDLLALPGQTHLFYEAGLMFRYWQRLFAFFRQNL